MIDKVHSPKLWSGTDKSLIPQIAELRELVRWGKIRIPVHVDGDYNEADPLTRYEDKKSRVTKARLQELLSSGWYEPCTKEVRGNKKRKIGNMK